MKFLKRRRTNYSPWTTQYGPRSMSTGDRDKTESIFVETEQFIRVKGLNRKNSRKVRMLHHCYVFERMFHESTYLQGIGSSHRSRARKMIESSGAVEHSKDGLSFRIGDWSNLDQQLQKIESRE
jgi:arginine metabolism regulation protein II